MSRDVIYVERDSYNGYGDNDKEGGDILATCIVVGFVLFLIIML